MTAIQQAPGRHRRTKQHLIRTVDLSKGPRPTTPDPSISQPHKFKPGKNGELRTYAVRA